MALDGTPAGADEQRFVPETSLTVSDLETLRVLADPLRLRILEAFARDADTPQTVKRVAGTIGEGATKLYYHVNLLEERGLLKVVQSRVVSGIIEKRYQPVARSITVDRAVLMNAGGGSTTDAVGAAIQAILGSVQDDVLEGMREGRLVAGPEAPIARRAVIAKTLARLAPERAEAFHARVRELLDEFDADEDGSPDAVPFALLVAFYPARTQGPEDDDR